MKNNIQCKLLKENLNVKVLSTVFAVATGRPDNTNKKSLADLRLICPKGVHFYFSYYEAYKSTLVGLIMCNDEYYLLPHPLLRYNQIIDVFWFRLNLAHAITRENQYGGGAVMV
ncbi:hypothetical protein Trydic_g21468 [Trypoxylus dichotomus]